VPPNPPLNLRYHLHTPTPPLAPPTPFPLHTRISLHSLLIFTRASGALPLQAPPITPPVHTHPARSHPPYPLFTGALRPPPVQVLRRPPSISELELRAAAGRRVGRSGCKRNGQVNPRQDDCGSRRAGYGGEREGGTRWAVFRAGLGVQGWGRKRNGQVDAGEDDCGSRRAGYGGEREAGAGVFMSAVGAEAGGRGEGGAGGEPVDGTCIPTHNPPFRLP
jgi:hypothetical protein